jgi:5-methylthioadenosine/S-adenosylhomocysteine deaminase
MVEKYSLSGVPIVTQAKVLENSSLVINNSRLAGIGKKDSLDLKLESDLILFPAIINVHDHLRGNYLPKVGPTPPNFYEKCADWEKELRVSDVVKERSKLSEEDCYFLSAYKNLFSGAPTVNDHYPHEINNKYIPKLPIRVISNYSLAHETTKYSLDWGDGIETEHNKAVKGNHAFIIHMEEGFTEEYQKGIEVLEELDCLDEYDILIHCIGFSEEDIKKTKKTGATVTWCPASNYYMYNATCKIKKILKAGINVTLGTDSTATGSINIIDEIHFAQKMYKKMYGEELDLKTLFNMVTINPAKAFRMDKDLGSIEKGKLADLLLIRTKEKNPYKAFSEFEMEDIELVLLEGRPLYGSSQYKDFFNIKNNSYSDIKVKGREKFVIGNPVGLMHQIREKVGFKKVLDFLPFEE